ncbi:MAG: hypothetical protein M9890_01400 [Thermomicrobiales bacterium]|nr:hypothetical protein [Thermomicrobiales bacterium]
MHCVFTHGVLAASVAAGIAPIALLTSGPPGIDAPIERVRPLTSIPTVGTTEPIPSVRTFWIDKPGSASTLQLIRSLEPDVIAVACFPHRIPHRTVRLARFGGLNVHPSPLPVGRGPDPLFWTFRRGDGNAAVSIHALTGEFDAGAIYAQQPLTYQPGIRENELDANLAQVGGTLLADVITHLMNGTAQPSVQDDEYATYEPLPRADDYVVSNTEPVERAYTFIRGIAGRGYAITIRTDRGSETVSDALAYDCRTDSNREAVTGEDWIQFADGWLRVLR